MSGRAPSGRAIAPRQAAAQNQQRQRQGGWTAGQAGLAGLGAGFLLPSFLPGMSGGGGSFSAIGDVIQLLPLLLVGGGALYAVSVFKK